MLAADGVCVWEPSGVEEVEVGERSAAGAGARGSPRSSRRSCFGADAPAPAPGFEVILLMPVFGVAASVPELLEHNMHTHIEYNVRHV